MKILALEFSSPRRSVAVLDFGSDGSPAVRGSARETDGRHTRAFALVAEALRQAGLEREQVECVVVGLGPGSYTGIRLAIAIAQGWQLARGVRLLGVSSVECLAAQARTEGVTGRIHVIVDAQREEFYLATYQLDAGTITLVEPLRLATREEVAARLHTGGAALSPDAQRWFPAARLLFPEAGALAQLAAARSDFVSGDALQPIYLREARYVKAPPPRVVPSL
jgi:tRNA threonylcarbamoyl adenosine modification protein YeaZ